MKKLCATFINALNTLNSKNITTREELLKDQTMYTEFWFATERFVSFALSSKTSKENKKGEIRRGNRYMIDELAERGVTSKEDIHLDCVIKIMSKLDYVLKQRPVEKQHNYAYNICNHLVCDQYDLLPPEDIEVISLQETIKSKRVSSEDACAYEERIGSDTYNGARVFEQKETVAELTQVLEAKKAKERSERRETIIKEIQRLYKKPAEVCVRLACEHLGMNPRELAARIAEVGEEAAYVEVLMEVAERNNIELAELRNYVGGNRISVNALWSETKDVKVIASQISRLAWRAKDKLRK